MKKSLTFSICFKEEENSSIISISHLLLQIKVNISNTKNNNYDISSFEKEMQTYVTNLKMYNDNTNSLHTKETLLTNIHTFANTLCNKYSLLLNIIRLYNTNSISHEYLEI